MGYSPWTDARERHPDVAIARADLDPARGAWIPAERVILIDGGLRPAERDVVLAHEIAHLDLDHERTGHGWFDQRQERQADQLACVRLVTLEQLARLLQWASCVEEIAVELGVTVETVRRRVDLLTEAERAWLAQRLASVA